MISAGDRDFLFSYQLTIKTVARSYIRSRCLLFLLLSVQVACAHGYLQDIVHVATVGLGVKSIISVNVNVNINIKKS
jgi:hypothetical protein